MYLFYQSLKHISEDDADSLTYDYATHYSYDVSGNVYTLVQELGGLRGTGNDFKRMDYEYDLVSGKVNQVNYQPDSADQYYYQYIYDEDNRLVNALTSIDNHLWQNEATYLYYKHGPLRRTEIGERQVQGMDFAYTLQGWLKGMNSEGRDQGKDMGGDGKTSGAHKLFGRDVASFLLSYFEGDYRPIGTNRFTATYSTSGGFGASSPSLYNGNIRKATYSLANLTDPVVGYAYGYDQLNRLVSMDAWVNFNTGTYAWQTSGSASSKLQERVTYDANGNITKYLRKGYSPTNMDSLTYKYYPKSNKLLRVDDSVSVSTYADIDVDDQDNDNYEYDLTGNLVKDSIEGISLITWNLMGKVDSIARYVSSSRPELKFLYDAMGNRVGKIVYDGSDVSKTWYIRDAQGNIMATYEEENDTLTWAEQHIYGSSRLGYWQPDSMMFPKPALPATDTFRYKVKAGDKLYEIANHLGNVLATITDRKIPKETGTPNGIADYYVADIATVQDYYPFGMVMPGRNWKAATAEGYGFGFNGKENDDDVKGDDNSLDFGARIYDPRLGKWLSLDPLQNKYPFISAYAFAINSPIQALDPDGRLVIFINGLSNFLACCPGEKGYWGSWADAAMNKIQDHNAMYVDGENIWFSTVEERTAQGYRIGQEKAKDVIDNLAKDSNGKIIESVKIITHSMGAATERGFSNALIDYVDSYNLSVEEHNKTEDQLAALAKSRGETYIPQYQQKIEGFKIEFVVDISAYQSKELIADFNAEARYYMRNTDGFNANTWPIQGAQEIGVDNNGVPKADDHGLGAFDPSDIPTDKDGIDNTKMTEYGNETN